MLKMIYTYQLQFAKLEFQKWLCSNSLPVLWDKKLNQSSKCMPVNCIDLMVQFQHVILETTVVAMLALIHVNLFHLLSLGHKAVATDSRINYFSVASASSRSLSKVFSADRIKLIAGFSCISAQFLVWKKELCKLLPAIVASASWD